MKTFRLRVTSSTIKTKNENEMKTKNNVQKTILRFAAVVISFVLISFTVSAQDFWKKLITGSGFNAIALAMVDHTNYVNHYDGLTDAAFDFALINETEEELALEPWMMDDKIFGTSASVKSSETDVKSKHEHQMLSDELFNTMTTEERLKLEGWMLSESVWN
ncbi:MAG: hypothetical protein JXR61_04030 [Prolixibacteraceae bacterium]|nr:hypothetical protein [Prolixibacteraceae bacterium]